MRSLQPSQPGASTQARCGQQAHGARRRTRLPAAGFAAAGFTPAAHPAHQCKSHGCKSCSQIGLRRPRPPARRAGTWYDSLSGPRSEKMTQPVASRVSRSSRVWMSYSIMKEQNRRTARKAAVSSCVRSDRPAGQGKQAARVCRVEPGTRMHVQRQRQSGGLHIRVTSYMLDCA